MFKQSNLKIHPEIKVKVDKGYVGIDKFHANTDIPNKASKNKPLSKEEKRENREMAKERIGIEHLNAKLKIFRMLKETYRNHKNFKLRATLIAIIYNGNLN